ncbi:APC family permease [Picrophilus oshimae]|nr:APC family permease [Picrophilus oshimae]
MIRLSQSVMQSFTSIGPMLDFVALFSIIASYSGTMLPFVVLFSFILSYSTLYTVYQFSRRFTTNGGYYSYVGNTMGKSLGLFVMLFYIMYSILTVPNLSIFVSSFIYNILIIFGIDYKAIEYVILIIFIILVYSVIASGSRISIKYTLIAGLMEMSFIIIMSILFLGYRHYPIEYKYSFNAFFLGVIFGILAFSGGGSSIFLSENTRSSKRTTPRALLISYTLSGSIMVFSAFALLFFVGVNGIYSYSIDPYYIVSYISDRFGIYFMMVFAFFAILSAFNLSVSYLNAFVHMMPRMLNDLKIKNRGNYIILLFLISIVISFLSISLLGFFNAFVFIAGLISFLYIVVHIITNISLIRINRSFVPVLSGIFLIISMILSFSGNMALIPSINYAFIIYLIISIIIVLIIRSSDYYKSINFYIN